MRAIVVASTLIAAAGLWFDAAANDLNLARLQGAYATAPVTNAAACARLCADDGLCIAWTLETNGTCSLTAIAAPGVAQTGAISGFSDRAPASLRAPAALRPPPEPLRTTTAAIFAAPEAPAELAPDDFALLGGPEGE